MRKVIAGFFISLDGVVEALQDWHFPYFNDEMGEAVADQSSNADTMLFGRNTFEEFAGFWPQQGSDVPFADVINSTPKVLVTTTLHRLGADHDHRPRRRRVGQGTQRSTRQGHLDHRQPDTCPHPASRRPGR